MSLIKSIAVVLAAALVAMPALAGAQELAGAQDAQDAQEPVRDFSQLHTRLEPGDTVWVIDGQGREFKGEIASLREDALTLDAGGARTFTARDVGTIQKRRRDSLLNGTIIGATPGVLLGLGFGNFSGEWRWGDALAGAAFFGAIGAGIGAGIDALIPGKKTVAYRAPDSSGAASARLSVVPVLMPRHKGVAVALSF